MRVYVLQAWDDRDSYVRGVFSSAEAAIASDPGKAWRQDSDGRWENSRKHLFIEEFEMADSTEETA